MELGQQQEAEGEEEVPVDERLDRPHLEPHELLVESFEAPAMWLIDELLVLLLQGQLDIPPLLLILTCLPVERLVHCLEEHPFEIVLHIYTQRRVLDIWCEALRQR